MPDTQLEKLFTLIDEAISKEVTDHEVTSLESLVKVFEQLIKKDSIQKDKSDLRLKFEELKVSKEEVHKVFQLHVLKALKSTRDYQNSNYQMTPDQISHLLSYLAERFLAEKESLDLLDYAVGTGNLLATVLQNQGNKLSSAVGIELDEVLAKIAELNFDLQDLEVDIVQANGLKKLEIEPVDLIVSELPVGLIKDQAVLEGFVIANDKTAANSQDLFIEQAYNILKQDGYLAVIVPQNFLISEDSGPLKDFIQGSFYIQGIVQLDESLFINRDSAKSILIMQKQSELTKQPNKALLIDLPKLENHSALQGIFQEIDEWFRENK